MRASEAIRPKFPPFANEDFVWRKGANRERTEPHWNIDRVGDTHATLIQSVTMITECWRRRARNAEPGRIRPRMKIAGSPSQAKRIEFTGRPDRETIRGPADSSVGIVHLETCIGMIVRRAKI